jgi:hypothetical protein
MTGLMDEDVPVQAVRVALRFNQILIVGLGASFPPRAPIAASAPADDIVMLG